MIRRALHRVMPWLCGALWISWIALVAVGFACTNTRSDTLRATFVALNAARDTYTAWDRDRQLEIVKQTATREEYERAIIEHRTKRDALSRVMVAAYEYLADAAISGSDKSLATATTVSGKIIRWVQALKPLTEHPPLPSDLIPEPKDVP